MSITYGITRTATQIHAITPYNPDFINDAKKQLDGKWQAPAWVFDSRDEAEVLALVESRYGWKPGMKLVSALVRFPRGFIASQGPVVLLGRALVTATGRDSGAKLGDGVRLREGDVTSGGSAKNWTTVVQDDTELAVHDVPEGIVRDWVTGARKSKSAQVDVELLETTPVWDVAALTAERHGLAARIAEIDKLLADGAQPKPEATI